MGYGKLNIWFRHSDCTLTTNCWRTDLVIMTGDGRYLWEMDPTIIEKLKQRYPDYSIIEATDDYEGYKRIKIEPGGGREFWHIEVDVPPGCYVVWTRICHTPYNDESNKVMVVVDCGKEVCVNLLVNRVDTCAKEILGPFARRALELGLPDREVVLVLDHLLKVAGIPRDVFIKNLNLTLQGLEKSEAKEALKLVGPTTKILAMVKALGVKEQR